MNPRIDALIEAWLHGTISPADLAVLDQHLREDPEARRALRRSANLDAALRAWAEQDGCAHVWLEAGRRATTPRTRGFPTWAGRWVLPAAAVLTIAALWSLTNRRTPPSPHPAEQTAQGTAVLTQAVNLHWRNGDAQALPGDLLRSGPIALDKGLAQIEFFSGATLIAEAPATFEIISPWQVIWHGGKAHVRVPPAARGFEVFTPGLKLIDLGTEFGIEVDSALANTRVQVFAGEVEAHPDGGARVHLQPGDYLQRQGGRLIHQTRFTENDFVDSHRMRDLVLAQRHERYERWRDYSLAHRQDPRLIAYYPMDRDPLDRLLRDTTRPSDSPHDGGVVGAIWGTGRWAQKSALVFKRPGDRVRLNLAGSYDSLTFTCWARVDGLDRKYNSLLLTDGYDYGNPHWQIFEDGRLMFSLQYPEPADPSKRQNYIFFSPVAFDRTQTGRWHHLAVTYDGTTGAVAQFMDGIELSREIKPLFKPGRPIAYGPCELGNWGLPTANTNYPIRNLNGGLDEFSIYSSALAPTEIRAQYEAGRPE